MEDEGSTFSAKPDRLDRLVSEIMAEPEDQDETSAPASLDMLVEKVGSWIDRYKLLEVLGEGGMGIVYLAEQAEPIKRQVALKVIKPGMDSQRVVARFEAERQALALLDHPNIAHVYDAGTTEAGRPYFAMEHVEGLPITEYCDRHKLTIEQRLRLFQQVCLAVHHAHQKGIIHRDLKPSNILVSAEDDHPIPKIIDFGVAKAISQPLTERISLTEDSQLLGTPEYMSPEQAEMVNEDIDTRSDIYSLGVLLYVLLAGILPYDSETLRQGGIEHVRKTIRETDPKTPSTRLTKLGEEAKELAESRRTEVATLAKRLRRELEWIPLKAMRKERAERYRSASELADDIENYLKGTPLIAGPPRTIYRLKKFLRRNAVLSSAVVVVALTMVLGFAASTAMYLRAQKALSREAGARAQAQAVTEFLTEGVLASVDKIKGHEPTVADILDIASQSLGTRFEDQPLVEADICHRLGRIYQRLGDHRAAMPHLARAYQIRREQLGEGARLTRITKNHFAFAYVGSGQFKEAERLFSQLIGQGPGMEEPNSFLRFKMNLACGVYLEQGRYKEAERLYVETAKAFRGQTIPYRPELAEIYLFQGRIEEAQQLFTQILAEEGEVALKEASMSGLGCIYVAQGRYAEAEDLFTRGIEIGRRERPGVNHPHTLKYVNELAVLRTKQKRYPEAEKLFQQALEARKDKLGDDHPDTLESLNDFGVLRREQGQYDKAEELLTKARDRRKVILDPDHPHALESAHELAVLRIAQSRYEEAERLLLEGFHGREAKLGPEHPHTIDSLKQLVNLYESWGKPDEAEKWRAKLLRDRDAKE